MIRILIADDHPIVRQGLRLLISQERDMTVAGQVDDGAEVCDAALASGCHVVVLDLSLPNVSGRQLIGELARRCPDVGVLVLSMYPEDQLAVHLLRSGARGYLSKSRPPEEVLDAIRTVAAGRRYVTERLADLIFERQLTGTRPPHERLTPRESDVFFQLIEGLTVSEIAGRLERSPSTISNYVAGIRDKLGVESVGGVVRYAHRAGLLG